MSMNFWKNPEYNGIKTVLIIVVAAGLGFVAYNGAHTKDSNLGQVVSVTARGAKGGATGSGTGTGGGAVILPAGSDVPTVCDKSTVATVTPTVDATFTPGPLHFDMNGQFGGRFIITNSSPCDMKVTAITLSLISPYYPATGWTPVGGIMPASLKLHVGPDLSAPLLFGAGAVAPMTGPLRQIVFVNPAGYIIPPMTYQPFALEVSSWNTNPGGNVAFRLNRVTAINMLTSTVYNWMYSTSGATPASVTTTPMTVVMP